MTMKRSGDRRQREDGWDTAQSEWGEKCTPIVPEGGGEENLASAVRSVSHEALYWRCKGLCMQDLKSLCPATQLLRKRRVV
jgi:hypothetical protein